MLKTGEELVGLILKETEDNVQYQPKESREVEMTYRAGARHPKREEEPAVRLKNYITPGGLQRRLRPARDAQLGSGAFGACVS